MPASRLASWLVRTEHAPIPVGVGVVVAAAEGEAEGELEAEGEGEAEGEVAEAVLDGPHAAAEATINPAVNVSANCDMSTFLDREIQNCALINRPLKVGGRGPSSPPP
jgi:hypothetical protein